MLITFVSAAATVVCVAMLGSPAQAAWAFKKAGTVGALRINFYTMQMVNCTFWAFYGILISSVAVTLSNVCGVCVAVFCICLFLSVARNEESAGKKLTSGSSVRESATFVFIGVVFATVVLVGDTFAIFSGYQDDVVTFMGFAGSVTSCVMLASPLQQAKYIIQSRNADVLNPSTVFLAVVNCLLWIVYGLLTANPFIWAPNGIGLAITLGQLYLLLRYGHIALPSYLRAFHVSRRSVGKSSSDDVSVPPSRHESVHDMSKMIDDATIATSSDASPSTETVAREKVTVVITAPPIQASPKLAPEGGPTNLSFTQRAPKTPL